MANNKNFSSETTQGEPKYKAWWDEKENIGRCFLIGDVGKEIALEFKKEAMKILEKYKNVKVLFDLSKAGVAYSAAREILTELARNKNINKIAFFGAGVVQKVIADFIVAEAGLKNIKHFNTEEEALKWLKEK